MSGKGQRFVDRGYTDLKPFIKIKGQTIISRLMRNFTNATEVYFILNENIEKREEYEEELIRIRPDAKIVYIPSHKRGPSYAIWLAKERISSSLPILVSYCDFSGEWNDLELIRALEHYQGLVVTYSDFHPHMLDNSKYAYIKTSGDQVTDIREKESFTDNPMSEDASCGIYGFENYELLVKAISNQIALDLSFNQEFYTSLTIKSLLDLNGSVGFVRIKKFYQWGTPDDLEIFLYWLELFDNIYKSDEKYSKNNLLHPVVILSAGEGNRIYSEYGILKPFLPVLNRKLIDYSVDISSASVSPYIFIKKFEEELYVKFLNQDIKLITSEFKTRGQAESALKALQIIRQDSFPITFLSVDNVLPENSLFEVHNQLQETNFDLLVWTFPFYPPGKNNPNHFSWVDINEFGEIDKLRFKQEPNRFSNKFGLVIGNFTFKSINLAKLLCEKLFELGPEYNGEYYLDRIIDLSLNLEMKVGVYTPTFFVALGTKNEYESFKYWSECDLN